MTREQVLVGTDVTELQSQHLFLSIAFNHYCFPTIHRPRPLSAKLAESTLESQILESHLRYFSALVLLFVTLGFAHKHFLDF